MPLGQGIKEGACRVEGAMLPTSVIWAAAASDEDVPRVVV